VQERLLAAVLGQFAATVAPAAGLNAFSTL